MNAALINMPLGLKMKNDIQNEFPDVLNTEAMDFIIALHEKFNHQRLSLLNRRIANNSDRPTNATNTKVLGKNMGLGSLEDNRIALSGSIADFSKDSAEMLKAKRVFLSFSGKTEIENTQEHKKLSELILDDTLRTNVFIQPRGFAEKENNVSIHESDASAALYDFGLSFFNNAYALIQAEKKTCYYLNDVFSAEEAKWWNDVFTFAQSYIGLPVGSVAAQVNCSELTTIALLENILSNLQDHLVGTTLNLRQYFTSHLQTHFNRIKMTLPNLDQLSVKSKFVESAIDLVVHISHNLNVPCAVNPYFSDIKNTGFESDAVYLKEKGVDTVLVKNKEESGIVERVLPAKNQIENKRFDVNIENTNLDVAPIGTITEEGVINCVKEFRKNLGSTLDSLSTDDSFEALVLKNWINHSCKTVSGKKIDLKYCMTVV